MTTPDNTLQQLLLRELRLMLVPLTGAIEGGPTARLLSQITGWGLEDGIDPATDSRMVRFARAFQDLDAIADNAPASLTDVLRALGGLQQLWVSLRELPVQPTPEAADAGVLGRDLVEALVLDHLRTWHPLLYDVLALLTIIRPPAEISPGRATDLLTDPLPLFREAYLGPGGLGSADDARVTADRLFPLLAELFQHLGMHTEYRNAPATVPVPAEITSRIAGSMLTVYIQPDFEDPDRSCVVLALSPRDLGGPGLVVLPSGQPSPYWDNDIDLSAAPGGFAVGPDGMTLFGTSGAPNSRTPNLYQLPGLIVGAAGGTRLEIGAVQVSGVLMLGGEKPEYGLNLDLGPSALVISAGDVDSFLASILPADGLQARFELGLGWSNAEGLHFRGSAGLDVTLPGISIGSVLTIPSVTIGLHSSSDRVSVRASAGLSVAIGPVRATVDGVGFAGEFTFPADGGNLGVADLALGVRAPTGIGLAIDASVLTGGGFIGFDPAKEEYAGVLELALGPVSVKAIAVLTTRLPDGREGWALMLLVFSEFDAVQLGYGFTLDGVGGMVGLQHGVSTQALQDGLRSGALDAVLFPDDPVTSAPQLLGHLRVIFPIVPRALTIGPALKIGWSTPPIVTLDLGLLIQVDDVLASGRAQPQIARVVLVGQLAVKLPPDTGADVPELLKLLVDVVGGYELREQALSIDARLRDSHVAGLPLSGSLVVRARFGESPSLILAVGGFHPRFTELPPGLPPQERIGFELRHDIVTVRITGYVAVTANTFQVGADADLNAVGGNFKIRAALGFDALFEFEPVFHFEIDFRVSASISYRGRNLASVKVEGVLRGPGRWEVSGRASFSILFWDVSIGFELGWGDVAALPLATVAVGEQLVAALSDRANWAAELPIGGAALVTLRKAAAADGAVAAHPLGEVVVTQKVVPLGIDITRVGTARPSDGTRFDIARVVVPGRDPAPDFRDEHFARGRYLDLDPEQRLSTPSFERFRAGVAISSADFRVAADQVAFAPDFETIYLGEEPPPPGRTFVDVRILVAQARFGAASLSELRRDERLVPDDLDTRISVGGPAFATGDGNPSGTTMTFGSFTEAAQRAERDGTLVFEGAELAVAP